MRKFGWIAVATALLVGGLAAPAQAAISCGTAFYNNETNRIVHSCSVSGAQDYRIKYTLVCNNQPNPSKTVEWEAPGGSRTIPHTCAFGDPTRVLWEFV